MKKTYKKLMVYGLGAATVGGIATGITVPIVVASNQVHDYNPLPDMNKTTVIIPGNGTDKATDGNDLINGVKSAGIEDKTLLHKTEYATAFYLYKKEQESSIKYQTLDLRYSEFKQLNKMFYSLPSNLYKWNDKDNKVEHETKITLKDADDKDVEIDLSSSENQSTIKFDNLLMKEVDGAWLPDYDQYQKIYESLKKLFEDSKEVLSDKKHNKDDINKSKIERVESAKNSFTDAWEKADTGLSVRIERLSKEFKISDYDDSDFSSRFPKVLKPVGELNGKDGDWSGTGIFSTQAKIFMDQRRSFIESYKTREEAEGEWAKELTKKYNGATSEREAIESMVYNVVKSAAFARREFIINSNFTIDHILSGIYNEFIGYVNKDSFNYDATSGLQYNSINMGDKLMVSISEKTETKTSKTYSIKRDSKAFFFGTKSLDVNLINSEKGGLPKVFENRNMMKLNNAIFGYKQGSSLLEGWTLSKDMVKHMLYVRENYNTEGKSETHINADYFGEVFQESADEAKQKEYDWITNELISKYTETKDSTQYKMGNLGYMDGLSATNMTDGFGIGMLAAYDELVNDGSQGKERWFGNQAVTERTNLLTEMRTAIVDAFIKAGTALGISSISKTTIDETIFEQKNQNAIDGFIDGLSDAQIKQYFGIAIRDVFNKNAKGSNQTGMSQVFRITDKATAIRQKWGIYAFYAPAYGLHLVKVDVRKPGDEAVSNKNIREDMQKAANDQSSKSSSTNYATLYTNNYQLVNQIDTLLSEKGKVDVSTLADGGNDKQNALNNYQKYLNEYFKEHYPDYKAVNNSVADDVRKLTDSLIKSQNVERVSKTKWENFTNYLIKQFDAGLIDINLSVAPEKIYNAVKEIGGK